MGLINELIPSERLPEPFIRPVLELAGNAAFFIYRDRLLNSEMQDIEIPIIESNYGIPIYKNPRIRELALMEERIRFLHLESAGYPLLYATNINAFAEVVRHKMLNPPARKSSDDITWGFTSENQEDGTVLVEFHFPIPRIGFYFRRLKSTIGAATLAAWLKVFPVKIDPAEKRDRQGVGDD